MARVILAVLAMGTTLNALLVPPEELLPEEDPDELLLDELPLEELLLEEDPDELLLDEPPLEELLLDEDDPEELLLDEPPLEELLLVESPPDELPAPEVPSLFEPPDDPPHALSARVSTSPTASHTHCGDF